MEPGKRLTHVLTGIKQRYNCLLFTKLIMLGREEVGNPSVRHYDLEREAIETMAALIKSKVQAIQVKVFDQIRRGDKKKLVISKEGENGYGRIIPGSPSCKTGSRNYWNGIRTPNCNAFKSSNQNKTPSSHPQIGFRSQYESRTLYRSPMASLQSDDDLDRSFSALVSRVKQLELRMATNSLVSLQNSRLSKKGIIIDKLNKLEANITDLLEDQDIPLKVNQQKQTQIIHAAHYPTKFQPPPYPMKYVDPNILVHRTK